ncbi:MAG: nuclear transport factor 2 family protein [Verrucomicrobiales bacterium]|nr:nuclear transport factor 2 family protein [Verrucomicrobiales bacterium]
MKNDTENDEAAIRALIAEWAQAIRDKDVAGVMVHFVPKSVRFYMAPPLQATMPLDENLEGWFGTFKGPIDYEIRDLNIVVGGDIAYSHSFNRIAGTKQDGSEPNVWFRDTLCFRKIDDQWLIAHAHESVPFYMDEPFLEALVLKP